MKINSLLYGIIPLLSFAESAKFIGCYREVSQSVRIMNDGFKEFAGNLTQDICFEFCTAQGTNFAGLQYGRECFCSKTRPPYMYLKNNTECTMKCEGNPSETCGERLLLSVFSLDDRGADKHENKYIGCFEDVIETRMLPGKMWEFTQMLTPDFCMGQCWRHGYRYAGVQFGTECYCGDEFNEELRVDEEECSTPCSGDRTQKCGSGLRMNVYATGVTDLSDENKLLGCYEDEEEIRLLSGLELNLFGNNSPKRCLNICNSLGFKFAGLQFKVECFCGNRRPPSTLLVEENECAIPCPGDSNAPCGGNYRLLAYRIGPSNASPSKVNTTYRPDTSVQPILPECKKSVTIVHGKNVCKGDLIFSEEFNKPLDRTRWFHSILMPWAPDYDFIVYTNKKQNSFVKSGKLIIKPTLMDDSFVKRGKLSLRDCTGEPFSEECERTAISYAILPPVESAKLNTKESFSFKYGKVDIRAKLPEGDWLYPEIYLEPKRKIYGRDYASGRIRIAGARGNIDLKLEDKDIGGALLEAGIILGTPGEIKARSVVRQANKPWSSDFHNYTLIWSPDNMWFMVDGRVKQPLLPLDVGKLFEILHFKNASSTWSHSEAQVAPFDQECFMSIGLTVGGLRNFPDNSMSGYYKKPWLNTETKAMVNFLQSKDKWFKTWKKDTASLIIDSIKVTAL